MAAPEYVPVPPTSKARAYGSPDVVPEAWVGDRPGELNGPQPTGRGLGYQGPDQGYAMKLAEDRFKGRLVLTSGEHAEDAVAGCVAIATRRASLYGRAPVIHDLTVVFTMWGFLDTSPPDDLVALRAKAFEGVGNPYHYAEGRAIADAVPEATLRMTVDQVAAASPGRWRELVGATV